MVNQGVRGKTEYTVHGARARRHDKPDGSPSELQILGFQACVFGDSGEHVGANFDRVVKRPSVFALGWMAELSMGTA
jgi:hypothetical protein